MGSTVWIEVEGRPGAETHNDMNVLLQLEKPLDALAEKLGVSKLSSFFDWSVMDAAADAELPAISGAVELEAGDGTATPPDASWSGSASGLAAITALRRRLEEDWDALAWTPERSQQHWAKSLMEDLRFCQTILEDAVETGRRFRLVIVP
jgi:hypothetical protein